MYATDEISTLKCLLKLENKNFYSFDKSFNAYLKQSNIKFE